MEEPRPKRKAAETATGTPPKQQAVQAGTEMEGQLTASTTLAPSAMPSILQSTESGTAAASRLEAAAAAATTSPAAPSTAAARPTATSSLAPVTPPPSPLAEPAPSPAAAPPELPLAKTIRLGVTDLVAGIGKDPAGTVRNIPYYIIDTAWQRVVPQTEIEQARRMPTSKLAEKSIDSTFVNVAATLVLWTSTLYNTHYVLLGALGEQYKGERYTTNPIYRALANNPKLVQLISAMFVTDQSERQSLLTNYDTNSPAYITAIVNGIENAIRHKITADGKIQSRIAAPLEFARDAPARPAADDPDRPVRADSAGALRFAAPESVDAPLAFAGDGDDPDQPVHADPAGAPLAFADDSAPPSPAHADALLVFAQ